VTPADFKRRAGEIGLVKPEVKAGEVVARPSEDFGLGLGHAMGGPGG